MKTFDSTETILNIGPHHPLTHNAMRLITKLNGELVKSVEPIIGYIHRGFEKIAEDKSYLQYLPMVNKLDSLSWSMYSEAFCSAVEKAADIEVPGRAQYIRVLLMELNRISSHLFWLGTYIKDLGSISSFCLIFKEFKKLKKLFEKLSDQTILCNTITFGGVKHDIEETTLDEIAEFITEFPKKVKEYQNLIFDNPLFVARTKGIGIITKNKAANYSITGANLRSTGSDADFRKLKPYLIYEKLDFEVPTENFGDCYSRGIVRIREMIESLKIVRQCHNFLSKTKGKYINENVNPLEIYPKASTTISHVEGARGLISCILISDGSDKPSRLKWRSPSFYSIQILPEIIKNKSYSDMVAILGSLDISVAEADR